MAISLRLTEEETALIKAYAAMKNVSVSELIRQTMLDRIEEEYDLQAYEKAMKAFRRNPVTYSLDEVEKELGLR